MHYDAVLIHPPAIYDFRKRPLFSGPIAYTVGESTDQLIIPSVGALSIADYLDRNGYKVIVDNLGERMVVNRDYDAESHIEDLLADVYAVSLHWCVHSQGAIEVARLCKEKHPEAMVIMGGLTSTVFAEEIIHKFGFVDAVIRGEAEKPFLALMKALEEDKNLKEVPNLTFRNEAGRVTSNPLMPPSESLDEYEFTRLDLLEPKGAIFTEDIPPHWVLPVCRGCCHNCVTCGGSSYSYKTYLGRKRPAFRSPKKIAADLQKLARQGVKLVFLFQDPHMGGEEYWRELFTAIAAEKPDLVQLTTELFGPADEEYIKALAGTGVPMVINMSPESMVDEVRKAHGRNYTNREIFATADLCRKYNIPLNIFSMIALGKDTAETVKKNWEAWEQICRTNLKAEDRAPLFYSFGPMVLLDPGSPAFDSPEKYGYRLLFKNLKDYISGMSLPSWHQWISYETNLLNKDYITRLIIDSIEYSINLREKYGLFDKEEAAAKRSYYVEENKKVIEMVDRVMSMCEKGQG